MKKLRSALLILTWCLCSPSWGQDIERSWYTLMTGNGHGFQLFNRMEGKLDQFLEHPYLFVAPLDERRDGGVIRRDLMHDAYFGLSIDGQHTWLNRLTNVSYEEETNIILAKTTYAGINAQIRFVSPFGLEANALLMTLSLKNPTSEPVIVKTISKVNLNFGAGPNRKFPGAESERIILANDGVIETGPGGGHALHLSLDEGRFSCDEDAAAFERWLSTGEAPSQSTCEGDNQVVTIEKIVTIAPYETAHIGTGVLFLNDDPSAMQAPDFRDFRTVDDVLLQWRDFIGDRSTKEVIDGIKAEFESWRVTPTELGLTNLTPKETRIWRQSETVLRMGQVREPIQSNRRNFGMFLAALPPGEWHIGWVRDGAYAVVSQAMAGHHQEAREGVEFFLGAWAGFFNSPRYLGRNYRISSVRYYGNGKEEGDFNAAGPNVETDGFGLVLWAARAYLHYSCDSEWLNRPTLFGDTMYEALTQVAEEIDALLVNDLPTAECSIWETHWDYREVFTYTAATQIRGLKDFAAIAKLNGDLYRARYFRDRAQALLDASLEHLVHPQYNSFVSHQNVANAPAFVDGSTIEMLSWNFVEPEDPVFIGTMDAFSRLQTPFGGYRRLESDLSLTGESQASEYDLSQWVLLDLRIGAAFRKLNQSDRAEDLLSFVTDSAAVNDNLIPELFDPENGQYQGAIPMVGYGAGAWQMAQLEKYGQPFPNGENGWSHCEEESPMPNDAEVPESADMGLESDAELSPDRGPDEGMNELDGGIVNLDGGPTPDSQIRNDTIESGDNGCSTGGESGFPLWLWAFVALAAIIDLRRVKARKTPSPNIRRMDGNPTLKQSQEML